MAVQSPNCIIQALGLFRFSILLGCDSSRISLEANLKRGIQESWRGIAIFRYFEPVRSMPYASNTSRSVTTPSRL
jgi:hypothetical protein